MKTFNVLKKTLCAFALISMCSFGVFAQGKEDAPKPPKNNAPQEFVGKLDTAKVKGNKLITLTVDKEVYVLTVGHPFHPIHPKPPKEAELNAQKDGLVNPPPAPDVKPISIKELNVLKGTNVKLLGSVNEDAHVIIVHGIFTGPSDDAK